MSDEIITLLEKINQEEKTTILMVTHDVVIIENHPKRNIVLEKGHIVSDRLSGPTPSATTEEKPVETVSENEQIELNIGLEEESAGEQ